MIRLLICDDSAASRRLIRTLIEPHPGIEIIGEAGSGGEAIGLTIELEPDVVLMDVRMPELGGIDATRRLKEVLPATRVVAFAASKDEKDIKAMIDAGASAYCVKGCSAWELQREIVGSAQPLTRLAHLLSRGVPGSVGPLVTREVAQTTGALRTALYVVSTDAPVVLAAAETAAGIDVQEAVPAIVGRCLAHAAPVQATAEEREELRALGVPCGEALAVPVAADAVIRGVLLVAVPDGAQHRVDIDFVAAAADLAAGALANEQRVSMTAADARRDVLTGLLNRRAFDETLEAMLSRAQEEKRPLSLVVFDIDEFKSINDELGHAAGDETLRRLARIALRTIRADEEIFRVGGDEFAVVVQGHAPTAVAVAARIKAAILRQRHFGPRYTISVGIASSPPSTTAAQLLCRADEAMYEGKRGRRNRITMHKSVRPHAVRVRRPASKQAREPGMALPELAHHSQRLLIVDDDPALLLLLRSVLGELEFDIDEARSAEAAAERVASERPSAIVLDASLPDRDGLSFCRELKARAATRSIPVIVLGSRDESSEGAALDAGADGFHAKPLKPLELLALVQRIAAVHEGNGQPAHTRASVRLEANAAHRALLQQAFHETIDAFTQALAAKDSLTAAHSKRVVRYARVLTEAVAPRLLALSSLEYGFLLHDVGKIGIPDEILLKPGPLNTYETRVMQTHTVLGEQWLKGVPLLEGHGLQVIRSHHERWHGGGYPDGLRGQQIPIGGRIFAVADALDAMTRDRPYRPALSWSAAVEELVHERGRQFDPRVVDAFKEACAELEAIHGQLRDPVSATA